MTKAELIEEVSRVVEMTRKESEVIVEAIFDSIVRSLRGGKLNDGNFHTRMQGQGPFADQIAAMFKLACRKAGMTDERITLSTAAFRRHGAESLFD